VNILITGGAGFIGSNLANYHVGIGDAVYVVDDLSSGSLANITDMRNSGHLEFTQADITTWSDLDKVVEWSDRIYHMAAIVGVKKVLANPRGVMYTNITGTERLYQAIAKIKPSTQVLLASTSEVYGFNPQVSFRETDDIIFKQSKSLRWCYAVTKLADEYLAGAFEQSNGVKTVIARLFNTIGPNQTGKYGWVVPQFISQALHNEPITIYGDGSQTRSFCDVRDTVRALDLLASTVAASGEVVNVGNDYEISILQLANLIKKQTGSRSEIQFIPYLEAYGVEFEDIFHRRPVLSKLMDLTGFKPRGRLEDTLDYLINIAKGIS